MEWEEGGGGGGAGEGFMGVIMKSQWPGCWYWDISSHPPPIIRRMKQEGIEAGQLMQDMDGGGWRAGTQEH